MPTLYVPGYYVFLFVKQKICFCEIVKFMDIEFVDIHMRYWAKYLEFYFLMFEFVSAIIDQWTRGKSLAQMVIRLQ